MQKLDDVLDINFEKAVQYRLEMNEGYSHRLLEKAIRKKPDLWLDVYCCSNYKEYAEKIICWYKGKKGFLMPLEWAMLKTITGDFYEEVNK